MNGAEKTLCLKRVHRIEGQVAGILRMIENNRGIMDVLAQIQAAVGALSSLENKMMGCALAELVERGGETEAGERRRQMVELLGAVGGGSKA